MAIKYLIYMSTLSRPKLNDVCYLISIYNPIDYLGKL